MKVLLTISEQPLVLVIISSNRLATLYTQSRPIMLSRRSIAATAGTALVRDSQTKSINFSLQFTDDFTIKN